jgi:pimeloyl-ACP methyl ester carboxylesterase
MAQFIHDGLALAYDEIGVGETIILIHGFASNRNENWRRVGWYGAIERKRMRLIAADIRGHGESAKPHAAERYGRAALVGDVTALLDHRGIGKATLLGYSLGARIALATAMAHPDRVSHLILGGIGGKLFDAPIASGQMADAMREANPENISEPLLRGFRAFADEQGEDREALAACANGLDFRFERSDLGEVRCPTLAIAGARDTLAGDADDIARSIPGARAITIPGCDHFSTIPHALFKAGVFDFLEGSLE